MIEVIEDKEQVIRWIQNHPDEPLMTSKENLMRAWLNGRVGCLAYILNKMPMAWCLWSWDDGFAYINLMTATRNFTVVFQAEAEKYFREKGAKGWRFATTRPKAWKRLWPGFSEKFTTLEMEFGDD
jgi:hypothetical protein